MEKHRFATTSAGVASLADWLAEREVTTVAMEATGVYWKPVYFGFEALSSRSCGCVTPSM